MTLRDEIAELLERGRGFAAEQVAAYGHFTSWSEDDLGEEARIALRRLDEAQRAVDALDDNALAAGLPAIARGLEGAYLPTTVIEGLRALASSCLSGCFR